MDDKTTGNKTKESEWMNETYRSEKVWTQPPSEGGLMTSKQMCAVGVPTRLWLWRHQVPLKAGMGSGSGHNLMGKGLHKEHLRSSPVLSHNPGNEMVSIPLPPMGDKRHIPWKNWVKTFPGLETPSSIQGKILNGWMSAYWTVGLQALCPPLYEGWQTGAWEKMNNTRERLICEDNSGLPNRNISELTSLFY